MFRAPAAGAQIADGWTFDARHTPSDMGVLTELVRTSRDAVRSLHPTHPVSCIGPLASYFAERHQDSAFAFGRFSPFFRHAAAAGKILLIGVTLNSMTSFHIYEDLIGQVSWLPVHESKERTFTIVSNQGDVSQYKGYVHALDMAAKRDVELLRSVFQRDANMRTLETDFSTISILDARPMALACLRELRAGRSAYGSVALPKEASDRIESAIAQLLAAPEA